jgi:hypothetical protein
VALFHSSEDECSDYNEQEGPVIRAAGRPRLTKEKRNDEKVADESQIPVARSKPQGNALSINDESPPKDGATDRMALLEIDVKELKSDMKTSLKTLEVEMKKFTANLPRHHKRKQTATRTRTRSWPGEQMGTATSGCTAIFKVLFHVWKGWTFCKGLLVLPGPTTGFYTTRLSSELQ